MPSLCQTSNQSLELGTKDEKWKINASSCPELKGDILCYERRLCISSSVNFVLVVYILDRYTCFGHLQYPKLSHPTMPLNTTRNLNTPCYRDQSLMYN